MSPCANGYIWKARWASNTGPALSAETENGTYKIGALGAAGG